MRLVPLLLFVNLGYLVFVVCDVTSAETSAAVPTEVATVEKTAPREPQNLDRHLPLPGMEGWDQEGDACAAMEAFLQAASVELERLGAQPPIRPGQQILSPGGRCSLEDQGIVQLVERYRLAFEKAAATFPLESP